MQWLRRHQVVLWLESPSCRWQWALGALPGIVWAYALFNLCYPFFGFRADVLMLRVFGPAVFLLPILVGVGAYFLRYRGMILRNWIKIDPRCTARPPMCPACDFDLDGLAPEPDGCTVCPECGAAWRVGEMPEDVFLLPDRSPPGADTLRITRTNDSAVRHERGAASRGRPLPGDAVK